MAYLTFFIRLRMFAFFSLLAGTILWLLRLGSYLGWPRHTTKTTTNILSVFDGIHWNRSNPTERIRRFWNFFDQIHDLSDTFIPDSPGCSWWDLLELLQFLPPSLIEPNGTSSIQSTIYSTLSYYKLHHLLWKQFNTTKPWIELKACC